MKTAILFCSMALLPVSAACGGRSEDPFTDTPYDPGDTTVVGQEPGGEDFRGVDGNDCVELASGECFSPEDQCGARGAADVIVDESGNIVDVVCYRGDVDVDEVPVDRMGDLDVDGNNVVIVLDGENDGADIDGDLTLDGNNTVVYGAGPDVSVIDGTVDINFNDTVVRGVRITGDVTIVHNNTSFLYCVIEGDLTITGNNTTLAECDVYGSIRIDGLNTTLVRNRFAGVDSVSGMNLICNGNQRIDDADGDLFVGEGEITGPAACDSVE